MHVERGPQGKILVSEVLAGVEIVPHIYEGLRSIPLPNVLPVYLREVFGEKQLCIDCTDLTPLIDLPRSDKTNLTARNNFLAFLISLFRAEDRFISRDYFLFDPKYIFYNNHEEAFFWCCFPVSPTAGNLYSGTQLFSDRLNLLLSCDYIASLFEESHRKKIWTGITSDNEDLLFSLTCPLPENIVQPNKANLSSGRMRKLLLVQLTVMCIALSALLFSGLFSSLSFDLWVPAYILIFGLSLLSILLFSGRDQLNLPRRDCPTEDDGGTRMTEIIGTDNQRKDPFFSYPKAFLRRLADVKNSSDKEAPRYPILVNDFLIGKDSILCDLIIDEKSISDRHARILNREGSFFFMDTGSSSGSKIGDRILYSHEEYPLTNEDILSLGNVHFQFHQYT